jgi:hypothetical protein
MNINRSLLDIIKKGDFLPINPINREKFFYNNPEEKKSNNPHNVWDFAYPDDYNLYKRNLKTQPHYWYYRHNPVKYTVNSQGLAIPGQQLLITWATLSPLNKLSGVFIMISSMPVIP